MLNKTMLNETNVECFCAMAFFEIKRIRKKRDPFLSEDLFFLEIACHCGDNRIVVGASLLDDNRTNLCKV